MENIYNKIKELVDKYKDEVIEIRRDIHMHPELGFKEYRTSKIVESKLKKLGIDVKSNIAQTGVVGILKGSKPGKVIALRADMDALPLEEDTGLDFSSINKGIMHACGHDCHTANLLGVAMILSELKEDLKGTVKFIFQPAEENGGGGREMLKAGVLKNPDVDAIFGIHVSNEDVGVVEIGYGNVTSFTDKFILRVKGEKAHTSTPEKGVDAIVIACQIVTALQSIISRQINPYQIATFSIGQINGGTAPNIVPDYVEIVGMMRSVTAESREILKEKIDNISKNIAKGMDGECEFIFKPGYPSVVNDKCLTNLFKESTFERYHEIKDKLPQKKLEEFKVDEFIRIINKPTLGGEDFGFFAQEIPACFVFVGAGIGKPLHNPKFKVDERVFELTLDILSSVAVKYLNGD